MIPYNIRDNINLLNLYILLITFKENTKTKFVTLAINIYLVDAQT